MRDGGDPPKISAVRILKTSVCENHTQPETTLIGFIPNKVLGPNKTERVSFDFFLNRESKRIVRRSQRSEKYTHSRLLSAGFWYTYDVLKAMFFEVLKYAHSGCTTNRRWKCCRSPQIIDVV